MRSLNYGIRGALIVGGIGLIGGCNVPMALDPNANQGPLAGLILGPVGAVVGFIGGLIYGLIAK